ncbi:MAG: DNA polymerase II large subunit, partial [Candidatus Diapherotrites archaeon]|nr:DNA polymerase II large subunit [Candidatus Diapherotrites archaeon]
MKLDVDLDSRPSSARMKTYRKKLLKEIEEIYTISEQAKTIGFDPSKEVESPPGASIGERVEGMVGPKGFAKRYDEILKEVENNVFKAELKVIEEIVSQKLGTYETKEKALEQAMRTVLAVETQGAVVSPIEGLTDIKILKNHDETEYIELWYAGPIRSAGGTAGALTVLWADYARHVMKLDKFKPTQDELGRYVEEFEIYNELLSRQAKFTNEQIRWVVENLPVCMNGHVGGTAAEVSKYRNLPRVKTNSIREGMLLIQSEGLLLKAPKLLKYAKTAGLEAEWKWLERFLKVKKSDSGEGEKKVELKPVWGYLTGGLAAGRPIFSYPLRKGGFRFRYGKTRNNGLMCRSVHPATMRILKDFLAVGTQLKTERPGKATCLTPCDYIDGPVVKLKTGEILRV